MKTKVCKHIDFSRAILDPPEIECDCTGHQPSKGCITGWVECSHYKPGNVLTAEEIKKKYGIK